MVADDGDEGVWAVAFGGRCGEVVCFVFRNKYLSCDDKGTKENYLLFAG